MIKIIGSLVGLLFGALLSAFLIYIEPAFAPPVTVDLITGTAVRNEKKVCVGFRLHQVRSATALYFRFQQYSSFGAININGYPVDDKYDKFSANDIQNSVMQHVPGESWSQIFCFDNPPPDSEYTITGQFYLRPKFEFWDVPVSMPTLAVRYRNPTAAAISKLIK